jgi:hypothetical protein
MGDILVHKTVKVLYVCPFAHDLASYSYMAFYESKALLQTGADVEVLTFKGLLDESPAGIKQHTVDRRGKLFLWLYDFIDLMRKHCYTMMFAKLMEYIWTLITAIHLRKRFNYDVLYLREGDPFLLILHCLNLFQKNCNWIVVLIGAEHVRSSSPKNFRQIVARCFYLLMNNNLWKIIFCRSSCKNNFVYVTENEEIKNSYDTYMQGILSGRIFCLPLGVNQINEYMTKEEARDHLGIPKDKLIFLCFGSPHLGKDWEVMYSALSSMSDVFLLQVGDQRFNDGFLDLSKKYDMSNRIMIVDRYISEEEKPYYFFSSDAVILSYTKAFFSNASSLWESCRFQIPVLVSDNVQLRDFMKYHIPGIIFEAQNAISLRESIVRFAGLNKEDIQVFKDNCRVFGEDFSIDKWAEHCLLIYKNYLEDK